MPGLTVQTLGELSVSRDGAIVPLPASKKTRALLAYLMLSARPQRRDRLCELFWEVPDDPRAAMRWVPDDSLLHCGRWRANRLCVCR